MTSVQAKVLVLFTAIALPLSLGGCIGDKYAAEVGYWEGQETRWEIWGDFTSLDECRDAAIAR